MRIKLFHSAAVRFIATVIILIACASPLSAQAAAINDPAPNPVADPAAVVTTGNARFTILTPQLIRMEWSPDAKFEDHASLVFINRRMPVPPFKKSTNGGWLTIDTGKLALRYRENSGVFTAENIQVKFSIAGKEMTWYAGLADTANLGGTTRTLDGAKGAVPLEPGLLSRDGWALVDDSNRILFDSSEWPWALPRPASQHTDWYFFAYGHDYRAALADFTRVAGRIPLPPRFAFGIWWSRYWAYTDEELRDLVGEFHDHNVPLDVLVIDMDWHPTFGVYWGDKKLDDSGHTLGWTGYTWNNIYFPDPPEFLNWAHQQGLKVTLNMHPASGVQPFEEKYPEMARAMGIDPATKKYVPFDIADKRFAINYMNIMHRPLEKQGVDFFWLDWQQENKTSLPGLAPTWWLNYVHFTDMEREGKRPLIYHRWGGLGNHRYQIGFSGDVISDWSSLAFQPKFTSTAANVGYGYWSHDIGGHIPGTVEPELYTRWLQWGVFSPILRTHMTKNPGAERRVWAFPEQYAEVMRNALLLRRSLIPYIYTEARNTYDSGISICHPLYYDYPEVQAAYDANANSEYAFGKSLIVAPVTSPTDPVSQLAQRKVWLPDGDWIEWPTGVHFHGPKLLDRTFPLDETPVYARAGSIIPMQTPSQSAQSQHTEPLILLIFPGEHGDGDLYEDSGDSLGYKQSEFAHTHFRQQHNADGSLEIEILPVEGSYPGMPTSRAYELSLFASWPPATLTLNGQLIPYTGPEASSSGWRYDGDTATAIIELPATPVTQKLIVRLNLPNLTPVEENLLDGLQGKLSRLHGAMHILEGTWPKGWPPDPLLDAAQSGRRISLQPATAFDELQKLDRAWSDILKSIDNLNVDRKFIDAALAHLKN